MDKARGLVSSIRLHFIYVYANHVHIQGSLTEAWPRRGIKPGLSPVLRCQLAAAVIEKRHEGTESGKQNVCSLGQLLRWPILFLLVADIYFHKTLVIEIKSCRNHCDKQNRTPEVRLKKICNEGKKTPPTIEVQIFVASSAFFFQGRVRLVPWVFYATRTVAQE